MDDAAEASEPANDAAAASIFFLISFYAFSAAAVASSAEHVVVVQNRGDSPADPSFGEHVDLLRGTMFYVCQGSCLCGTVNNRGKVIYCYGDLVPRHGELFADGPENGGKTSSKDLLAAQLGVWTFGILALLIVLLLIRKSISSLRRNLQKVTDRLPLYHDDDLLSTNSASSPPATGANAVHKDGNAVDSMVGPKSTNGLNLMVPGPEAVL